MAQVTGFQSLDCGSKSSTGYKDTDSDILWMPDSYNNMILGGTSASVQAPSSPLYYASTTRYTTIRYFDSAEYSKFCYVLPNTTQGKFYLVRASFWLGAVPPYYPILDKNMFQFNLLINADVWQNVVIQLPQSTPLVLEIYVQAISTSMAVCLSGKRTPLSDPPFISTLELRTLNENMHFHEYTSYALRKVDRIDYGPQWEDLPVRYRNDSLDRIWSPEPPGTDVSYLSTDNTVDNSGILDSPPMQVLQTAIMAYDLTLWQLESGIHSYFYALYFSEIDPNVTGPGQRVFDIILNGDSASPIFSQLDIFNETGSLYGTSEVYGFATAISVGWLNFTLSAIATSIYPALISALEIFESFDNPMSSGTSYPDLLSINNIIATLPNLDSYTGDPCLPSGYGYPWVTCSDITTPFPRVINISLSSQELVGEIPASLNNLSALVEILLDGNNLTGQIPDLSALTNLQVLNLSNNKLSGAIPDFLSKLPNLQYLYLQNNNLSGPIPVSLLEQSKFIQFDYSGNDFLCTTTNSTCYDGSQSRVTQHSGLKIGLAILGAFIFLGLLGTIMSIAYRRRRQKLQDRQSGTHSNER